MKRGPSHASGFTLIEVLVVLVIVGVVLTFATLSVNPTGPGDRLDNDSQRLFALAQTAADQAILSGHTIGLQIGEHGYRFITLTDRGWKTITATDSPLRPRHLDADVHLERLNDSGQADSHNSQVETLTLPASPIAGRKAGEPTVREEDDDSDQSKLAVPAALFLSSGELLPFTLEMSADGVDARYDITGAPNGDITRKQVDR